MDDFTACDRTSWSPHAWQNAILPMLQKAQAALPLHSAALDGIAQWLSTVRPLRCTPEMLDVADVEEEVSHFPATCLCDKSGEADGWCTHRLTYALGKRAVALWRPHEGTGPVASGHWPERIPWQQAVGVAVDTVQAAMPSSVRILDAVAQQLSGGQPLACTNERFEWATADGEMRTVSAQCACPLCLADEWCENRLTYAVGRRAWMRLTSARIGVPPLEEAPRAAAPVGPTSEPPGGGERSWEPARPQGWPHTAPFARSLVAIFADFARPLPDSLLAVRTIKGHTIRYLHWHTLALALDTYAPGWESTIVRETIGADHAACVVRLTVHGSDGSRRWESTGVDAERFNKEGEVIEGYGAPLERAERAAFRRACALAGLGRWLYELDEPAKAARQYFAAEKV